LNTLRREAIVHEDFPCGLFEDALFDWENFRGDEDQLFHHFLQQVNAGKVALGYEQARIIGRYLDFCSASYSVEVATNSRPIACSSIDD
jgi:hypothetical protein